MARIKRYLMIAASVACMLGTGYFMQAGARTTPVLMQSATGMPAQPVKVTGIELTAAPALPSLPAPAAPAALPAAPVTRVVARDMPLPDRLPVEEGAPGFACEVVMTATALDAAMVRLDIEAPCQPNARFTLHHTGMTISALTNAQGYGYVTMPALAEASVFIASFEGGMGAVATAQVPDLAEFDRFAVQWFGDDHSLRLHALEYGADFGDTGHVWSGAVAPAGDGTLVRLGMDVTAPAYRAEVYSFPITQAQRDGVVMLRLEAEVTADNCGHDLEAQGLSLDASGRLTVQDVILSMPDCGAVGDFLVLQNLFDDLKIAQN
jgi:hypothetical protein